MRWIIADLMLGELLTNLIVHKHGGTWGAIRIGVLIGSFPPFDPAYDWMGRRLK